ncbi:nucleotidyltransferase family protein [Novosphingopyxis sp. YJ-S2-01]|uniref:nucleotidyltransferase family protein n=1 Tax=Novosphingopyxis sp. YJ-S2-01 TaxID=2794021 RepID=UPI0018DD4210|nr:NTP transferase domain-containing protein [Novosphingopyxis sp. YJ-S2-01]MBH9536799.1 NTP transferase domain-containing protein [Novosphingopyxis sp. YJ-S2-01]
MKADRVAAVLLAAGAGSRFGGGKLDAMLDGRRIGAWSWAVLGELDWLASAIVVPDDVPLFAKEAGARLINNPLAASGMASSLHCAVGFAREQGADALLLGLADMPYLSHATIANLLVTHDGLPTSACAVRQVDGAPGAPALIGSSCFDALLEIEGDRGAGSYLASRETVTIAVEPGELRDIDRPSDLPG